MSTSKSKQTSRTGQTLLSSFSRVTALSEAGQDFSHHFLTNTALQPEIVGATGQKAKLRLDYIGDDDGPEAAASRGKGIPPDVRLPSAMIVLCALCNNCCYAMEFATFAVYFRQVHNWDQASLASVAQTAGDVMAAIAMQVVPFLFTSEYDLDELGCFQRCLHHMTAQPYNLSFILATWVLFNLGMMSPILPLAIAAQVLMGTTYVYSIKWMTDINLFYSLGDSKVFMALQVYCRSAESLGGIFAGILGTTLFTLDPSAPFAFNASLSCVTLLVYTTGFCARLGIGLDIETAEEKRSIRLGKVRVSSWKAQQQTKKDKTLETQEVDVVREA